MWPPILVIPTDSLAVFFPRVVFEHTECNLLFFAANHLVSNVVSDDGDLDLNIFVGTCQFGK